MQTPYNYHRALVWTAVMTALSHLDPNFGSVFAIEAVNEPIMDAAQTPDYGTCTYYLLFSNRTLIVPYSPEELRIDNACYRTCTWNPCIIHVT